MDIKSTGGSPVVAEPEDSAPWDVRALRLVDVGVDAAGIAENLRRTPAERLRRMQQMAGFLEAARRDRHRPSDLADPAEIRRQSKE
jgi:hypothetical protein